MCPNFTNKDFFKFQFVFEDFHIHRFDFVQKSKSKIHNLMFDLWLDKGHLYNKNNTLTSTSRIATLHFDFQPSLSLLFSLSIILSFIASPSVNFINMLHTNFSYKRCFGSFFHVHVTYM